MSIDAPESGAPRTEGTPPPAVAVPQDIESPLPSLPRRAIDVFLSPGRLFEGLRTHPAWVGALLLGGILVVIATVAVPAEMYEEMMRAQLQAQGAEGGQAPDPATMATIAKWAGAVGALVMWGVMSLFIAGFAVLVFRLVLGDEGTFKQYLSVVTHALIISGVGALLLTPLRIMAEDVQMTLNVGTFLGGVIEEGTYFARVLRFLELFSLWSYAVMGIGISKMDPKRGAGSAMAVMFGLAVALALIFAIFGGGAA